MTELGLLSRCANVGRQALRITCAKRVDVEPAAPRVTCIHRQLERPATRPDVHEDALDTLLMKLIVVAKTHDVLQQPLLVNWRACVADLHAAPVLGSLLNNRNWLSSELSQ